jgi:2-polyprenyl-6-methoxyphenol hydroxylase-like FAD-dependent oxidoreductase
MIMRHRVLIFGGGIAGLTSAIALGRQGHQIDVIERDPNWSVYGVGIMNPDMPCLRLRHRNSKTLREISQISYLRVRVISEPAAISLKAQAVGFALH